MGPAVCLEDDKMDNEPRSYYGGPDEEWICVFPGKMGITWKQAWSPTSKDEAEKQASKNRNTIAIPLAFWKRYKAFEQEYMKLKSKICELQQILQTTTTTGSTRTEKSSAGE